MTRKVVHPVLLFITIFILSSCTAGKSIVDKDYPIYFLGKIKLGNFPQSVIVRGTNEANPIMIHLHGGPGYPLYPFLKEMKPLEKMYTMVYWEQRGTAKSYNSTLSNESMNTDSLLRDLDELVQWVKQKYGVTKVFLWGHSWGTNLGILYAARHPENLWSYVGTGQSVNLYANERACYAFAKSQAQQHGNKRAQRQLQKIDTVNYTLKEALEVRKWVYTFGGIVHSNQEQKSYVNWDLLEKVWQTPEYTFHDKMNLIKHRTYSGEQLWDDMMAINLTKQASEVDVPVYFLEGKYDHLVSSQLALSYYNELKAPEGKHWVWFENSAHRPQKEEPGKFLEWMKKVKSENFPNKKPR